MKGLPEFISQSTDDRLYTIYEGVMNLDKRLSEMEHKFDTFNVMCDRVDTMEHKVDIMWSTARVIAGIVLSAIIIAVLYQIGLKN